MLHQGLSILLYEPIRYRPKQIGAPAKQIHQNADADPKMLTDPPHGHAVEVVHLHGLSDELIPI